MPERSMRDLAAYNKRYYAENRDTIRKRVSDWIRTPHGRYLFAKNLAKRTNHEWTLTEDEHSALVASTCLYCEGPLPEAGIGLDRIDNEEGYHVGNVVPCCFPCNRAKGDFLSCEELLLVMAHRRGD
jgi:5-methylcytosine-specific restriction endonuclease McrA